ncbi:MAG: hypothetical protein PHO00_02230 [bacterium]|nr:hypothetical protein [bacterium]
MEKTLLIVLVDKRKESAVTVQKILTEWGCMIKTRLGIHDGLLDDCSNSGLIILELVGQKQKRDELARKLNLLEGVQAKTVELSLKDK